MFRVLDFIPVVGTVKNFAECVICYVKGEGEAAAVKGAEAVIGVRKLSWVLDFIPVVGTVKNFAEYVICYVKGEEEAAAVKGIQAVFGGILDLTFINGNSFVEVPSGANLCTGIIGLQIAAHESTKQVTKVTVGVGTKIVTNAAWRLVMKLVSYSIINSTEVINSTEGVKVGEPIINNGILDLYKDVVEEFVRDQLRDNLDDMVSSGRLSLNSNVVQSINLPVPEQILSLVRNRLLVPFERNEYDYNFLIFDLKVQSLKEDLVAYMNCVNYAMKNLSRCHNILQLEMTIAQSVQLRKSITQNVEEIIEGKYYLTENALGICSKQSDIRDFHNARNGFDYMLKRLITPGGGILIEWIKELREASKK